MNEEQKEMFRVVVLQSLEAARPLSWPVARLRTAAAIAGFKAEEQDLAKNLRYLEAHGMIERDASEINKSVDRYLITQAGVAYLDENNLML